jgi:hypothetical protein
MRTISKNVYNLGKQCLRVLFILIQKIKYEIWYDLILLYFKNKFNGGIYSYIHENSKTDRRRIEK